MRDYHRKKVRRATPVTMIVVTWAIGTVFMMLITGVFHI